MKLNLTIDDAIVEKYEAKFGAPKHWEQMRKAIEAFVDVPKHDRFLIISGDTRRAIEAIFQTTLDTPEKLLQLTKKLNSVAINGVEVNFDAEELDRIRMQASFHGRTPEQYIKEMITEIKDRMLERV